jgi:hypothetical protein
MIIVYNVEVKIDVGTLLVFVCCDLRFFVSLKPCVVLLVVSPRVLFQLSSGQILLIGALRSKGPKVN